MADTAMVGGQMSRLDEALGSYMDYSQEKKQKLEQLGSMSKIDRLTEMASKVQEGVAGAGDAALAVSQFGTAMIERVGVKGIKNMISRFRGRGAGRAGEDEPAPEAEAPKPVGPEVSGARVPEGFTRMRGGAVGEAEEMAGMKHGAFGGRDIGKPVRAARRPVAEEAPEAPVSEAPGGEPIQMSGIRPEDFAADADEPRYEYTGGTEATGRGARPIEEAVMRGRKGFKTAGELEQEQMRAGARVVEPTTDPSFRYSKVADPAQEGQSLAERYGGYDPARLRGSSLIARATGQERTLPDPMSAFEGSRYASVPEGSRIPQPQGEVGFRAYRPQAERMPPPPEEPQPASIPRQPVAAQVEQKVGATEEGVGRQLGRVEQLQEVAADRIGRLRGLREGVDEGGSGGDTALERTATAGDDDEAVGSLLDTIGGWSGALSVLGGVGMLAGLGGTIYGAISASKEESEQQSAIRQEQQILRKPVNVNFGSLALPTYDTSQMRGGGGMGHF